MIHFVLSASLLIVGASDSCLDLYGKAIPNPSLPILEGVVSQDRQFPSGERYNEYSVSTSQPTIKNLETFQEKSVEVIYAETPPYGHVSLRIGKRIYNFFGVRQANMRDFKLIPAKTRKIGFVFSAAPEKIKKALTETELFHESSIRYNLPPYDAYSAWLEIETSPDGLTKRFKGQDQGEFRNNDKFEGNFVEKSGKEFLVSDSGWSSEIFNRNGKRMIQSFSCSTSASYFFAKYFDITLGEDVGARDILNELSAGRIVGRKPEAVVYYEP